MADVWKSQPRKYCEICKCWLADNKVVCIFTIVLTRKFFFILLMNGDNFSKSFRVENFTKKEQDIKQVFRKK